MHIMAQLLILPLLCLIQFSLKGFIPIGLTEDGLDPQSESKLQWRAQEAFANFWKQ